SSRLAVSPAPLRWRPSQRRPVAVRPFALNLPDLTLCYPELLGDEPAGLRHLHAPVLGLHQRLEDFLATRLLYLALGHSTYPLFFSQHPRVPGRRRSSPSIPPARGV